MAKASPRGSSRAYDDESRGPGGSALLPLLTFLIGAVLGGGLIWFATGGIDGESPLASGEPTPVPTATQTVTAEPDGVVIPGSCLRAADEAEQLTAVAVQGVEAARNLDAIAMSEVVREFGAAQERVSQMAEDCRGAAQAPGATTAPAPEPTTPAETPAG